MGYLLSYGQRIHAAAFMSLKMPLSCYFLCEARHWLTAKLGLEKSVVLTD